MLESLCGWSLPPFLCSLQPGMGDSFPYSFQSAGDEVVFQLSIGSAVFFFFLFGAEDGTQGLVYWIHLLYH